MNYALLTETLICPGHGPLTTVRRKKKIIHSFD
jgi:hypothetical protein